MAKIFTLQQRVIKADEKLRKAIAKEPEEFGADRTSKVGAYVHRELFAKADEELMQSLGLKVLNVDIDKQSGYANRLYAFFDLTDTHPLVAAGFSPRRLSVSLDIAEVQTVMRASQGNNRKHRYISGLNLDTLDKLNEENMPVEEFIRMADNIIWVKASPYLECVKVIDDAFEEFGEEKARAYGEALQTLTSSHRGFNDMFARLSNYSDAEWRKKVLVAYDIWQEREKAHGKEA